jgi:hypothetical protein
MRLSERQLSDMNPNAPITHSPATTSNLHRPPITSQDADAASVLTAEATSTS